MKISKEKALRLIDDKIALFGTLETIEILPYDGTTYTGNEEYKLVYYTTEANLTELFSEEEMKKFRQNAVTPLWAAINDRNPAAKFRAYNNHIQKCIILLKAYRERVEHFWPDDEDTLSVSPPFGKETTMSKAENTNAMDADTITDVVIITALAEECEAVLRHLGSYQKVQIKGRTFYRASVQSQKSNRSYQVVVLSLNVMGNYHAAVATQQAISVWNPSYIILAGIAGGVQKGDSRYLGDLLVGEQIVAYEPGKQTESGIQRRYDVYRPARALLEAAKNLSSQEWALSTVVPRPDGTTNRVIPHVHFGVVASGEKVVANNALTSELQSDWSQLVGIEMEGIGAAIAAYDADFLPGVLLVKGMCDWADASKNDDWQAYAADVAASFVTGLLKSEPFTSVARPQPVRKDGRPSSFSGKIKFTICNRLVDDWGNLADLCEIPAHYRAGFARGREPQAVWEWLEQRGKLSELENILELLGRHDLLKILKESQDD
jgi:nucleoside phosphorylase